MKLMIILFFMAGCLQGIAANYYCDASSTNKTANGTLAAPWKNIAQVNSGTTMVNGGDTIFFKRGQTYVGRLYIERSGSAGNPIVYTAYGKGSLPTFDNTISDIITLNNQTYVVIDRIKFIDNSLIDKLHQLQATISNAILLYNSPHCSISNCDFSMLGIGIATFTGSNYTNITGNYMHNLRMVRNTPVYNNNNDDYGAVPIVIGSSSNTISHNLFEECWAISYDYGYDGGAIEFFGEDMNNNFIAYNTAINCNGFIEIGSSSNGVAKNNVVAYNKIINCGMLGVFQNGGDYACNISNLQYYNNTIVETLRQFSVPGQLFYMAGSKGPAGMVVMKNNIFWCSNGTIIAGKKFNSSAMIRSNNIYRMSTGSLGAISLGANEYFSISAGIFTAVSGSPSLWNYTLPVGSVGIDFGVRVGLNNDFKGNPIVGNPDAGIYEYAPSASPRKKLLKRKH